MTHHRELWPVERIVFGLPTGSKREVIAALIDVATKGARLAAEKKARMLDAILAREKDGSTASGGLAIPHVKSPDLPESKGTLAALGVFPQGIDFTSVDRGRVHAVFLLLSPAAFAAEHVATLRWVAGVARQPDFMPFLCRTRTPEDVLGLLEEMGG